MSACGSFRITATTGRGSSRARSPRRQGGSASSIVMEELDNRTKDIRQLAVGLVHEATCRRKDMAHRGAYCATSRITAPGPYRSADCNRSCAEWPASPIGRVVDHNIREGQLSAAAN